MRWMSEWMRWVFAPSLLYISTYLWCHAMLCCAVLWATDVNKYDLLTYITLTGRHFVTTISNKSHTGKRNFTQLSTTNSMFTDTVIWCSGFLLSLLLDSFFSLINKTRSITSVDFLNLQRPSNLALAVDRLQTHTAKKQNKWMVNPTVLTEKFHPILVCTAIETDLICCLVLYCFVWLLSTKKRKRSKLHTHNEQRTTLMCAQWRWWEWIWIQINKKSTQQVRLQFASGPPV